MTLVPVDQHQIYQGKIEALLGVTDLSQIVREEIPEEKLIKELKDLSKNKSSYDKILFETDGKIEIANLRMNFKIYFDMVALYYYKEEGRRRDYLAIKPLNGSTIYVRKPRFWLNNVSFNREPKYKEANNLKIDFGRILNNIELKVQAVGDYKTPSAEGLEGEEGSTLYKLPPAFGYKLK